MTDDRPRYGEYASPEEQRARAGLPPLPPQGAAGPAGQDAATGLPGSAGHPSPASPGHPSSWSVPPDDPAAPARTGRGADRVLTLALLALGLLNVLSSIPGFLDLATTMDRTLEILGLPGEFTSYAAARLWGAIATVVLLGGYAATVWLALRRLRARRLAWWVPLAGFAVTMVLVSVCLSMPMFGDPAFLQGLGAPSAG
ncbi:MULTISPECIES: DUF6264 family protein [Microbacterium]|uniref:DUF6264 family protein n=1 Tax=Microbacterium TaxID=33882 RepID=UPI00217DCB86|nr:MULTISPECIES: DUF6264 family protein [Microbacterium]UWF78079.1 hypothetical protein JSY13_03300 [Microbacterium neungamense]WCM56257.1 hypothetical protein JRG78_03325 [Microbacterium sp. EF45047]